MYLEQSAYNILGRGRDWCGDPFTWALGRAVGLMRGVMRECTAWEGRGGKPWSVQEGSEKEREILEERECVCACVCGDLEVGGRGTWPLRQRRHRRLVSRRRVAADCSQLRDANNGAFVVPGDRSVAVQSTSLSTVDGAGYASLPRVREQTTASRSGHGSPRVVPTDNKRPFLQPRPRRQTRLIQGPLTRAGVDWPAPPCVVYAAELASQASHVAECGVQPTRARGNEGGRGDEGTSSQAPPPLARSASSNLPPSLSLPLQQHLLVPCLLCLPCHWLRPARRAVVELRSCFLASCFSVGVSPSSVRRCSPRLGVGPTSESCTVSSSAIAPATAPGASTLHSSSSFPFLLRPGLELV